MNEIRTTITIHDAGGAVIREFGAASHILTDPGEDIQAVHGWKRYIAERISLAVANSIRHELERGDVTAFAAEYLEGAAAAVTPKATPALVGDLLLLLGDLEFPAGRPTLEELEAWPDADLEEVATWAASIHGAASDNPVTVPPVPAVLERRGDDEVPGADDGGAAKTETGAAGAPPRSREDSAAGAASTAAGESGSPGAAEAPAGGADAGERGEGDREDHAGSGGAAQGDEGRGKVSRPGARRGRRGQAAEA